MQRVFVLFRCKMLFFYGFTPLNLSAVGADPSLIRKLCQLQEYDILSLRKETVKLM